MYYTRNTNTVVALAQAETGVKLGLQVGARLTDISALTDPIFTKL